MSAPSSSVDFKKVGWDWEIRCAIFDDAAMNGLDPEEVYVEFSSAKTSVRKFLESRGWTYRDGLGFFHPDLQTMPLTGSTSTSLANLDPKGMKASEWQKAVTSVSKKTFYRAKKKLLDAELVVKIGESFFPV